MPKLPPLSGQELVRALEKLGFERTGQRGSHVKLRRDDVVWIVPLHDPLKKGTLAAILRQARLTSDEVHKVLAH
jgi:predicted RNA binding protein YcfA (HicA-like mRNA interferase family)